MASWTIYSKNNVAKAVIGELELHDEWMAECYLTVSVKSAEPIDFAVGDYIDYRGERYTIQYDPNVLKKASRGSYGEGFTYDNIKFVGLQDEVARCDFNDIVLNDNELHYTALPTFPFYCESVDDLLDRIQANLEDLYPGAWIVIGLNTVRNTQRGFAVDRSQAFVDAYKQYIDPTGATNTDPYGNQGVAETADNITCWDAMKKVHDDFGLNFIVRGRTIIVGTAGVFTANTFRYGKGNGLYEIERIGESDQQIVTRLRAYGSEENLPDRYYATLNTQVFANVVSLHKFGTDGVEFTLDLDFDRKYFTYRSENYPGDTERPNFIVEIKANDVTIRGYVTKNSSSNSCYVYCEYTGSDDDRDEPDAAKMAAFVEAISVGDRVDFVDYVKKDAFDDSHKDSATDNLPNNMAVSRLMLPGFPNQSLHSWVMARKDLVGYEWLLDAVNAGFTFSTEKYRPYIDSPNIAEYGVRPASIYFDGSDETENIHPTIDGMENGGVPVDEIYAAEKVTDNGVFPAGEEVKNIDITLPNLGFDLGKLWDENATIDIKNGMCGARSFKIANKPKQDSNNHWVCNVERVHDDALNLWFPYCDFQIHGSSEQGVNHGDKYVLTGIALPNEYVDFAAEKLLKASIEALKKNHAPRYTYQPRIDEIWMQRQHDAATSSIGEVSLHDTLKAGDIFAFADADLNIDANVIIDILTIKENGNNGIPTYEVTLRDEKQVGTIEKITNKIDSVFTNAANIVGGGGLTSRQVQSLIDRFGGERFLSKLDDDTAQGFIRMLKGLQIGSQFIPDILGEGGVFRKRDDGKVELVADILYARVKAYFDSVEIREYQHTGGNRIASVAGNKICRVEWLDANGEVTDTLADVVKFRCYFRASDGEDTVRNNWVVGDQAYCHITSVTTSSDNPEQKGLNQKHLWRLVVGRNTEGTLTDDGEAYIDLSNRATETISGTNYTGYQSGSDIPEAQDDVIQLGNVNDTTRQGAIVEYVTGTDAPSYQIYQGISSFSLNGKNQVGFGYNTATGRAYMNVHGDAYIGDRNRNTYIEYKQNGTGGQPELNIKAKVQILPSGSTIDGQTIEQYIKSHQDNYDDTAIVNAIGGLEETTEELQRQIDGAIETWFMTGVPTLQNAPASSWTDNDKKDKHIGDLYYDKSTGHGYRFMYDDETHVYKWIVLTDEDVTEALRIASEAQETADGKRTVYSVWGAWVKSGVNTLEVGDLFIPAADTTQGGVTYKAKKVYKCKTEATNDFEEIAYTDDSALDNFKANIYVQALTNGTISNDITVAQNAANTAQSTANAAQTSATAANNKLTEWANDGKISPTEKLALKNQKADVEKEYAQIIADAANYTSVSTTAFTTAYNRAITAFNYYTSTTTEVIDIITDSQTDSDTTPRYSRIAAYYAARQTILNAIATAAKNYAYTQGQLYLNDAARTAIVSALGGATVVDGGLMLTSLIAMRKYKGTGDITDASNYDTWAGISGQYNATATGGGIAAWYGGGMTDKETLTAAQIAQGWSTHRWARTLFRFDGSGYEADGNITWNADGSLTIKNITTLSDTNNKNLLNELATFNSAFTFGTSGAGSTTALYITPTVPFSELYVGTSNATKKEVATKEWVGNGYISISFFERLFRAYNGDTKIAANDTTSTIDNIKAMFGFWTEQYLSALGQNSETPASSSTLADLLDVNLSTPTEGQALVYNGTKWVNGTIQAGTDMSTVWTNLMDSGNQQINASHLSTALSGYALASAIPTKTSDLTNDSGFLTSHQSLAGYATETWVNNKGYITGINSSMVTNALGYTPANSSSLSNYLPLSGGTMTGGISWSSNGALPESSSIDYFVVIDAFASGGRTKWAGVSSLKTSQLTNDAGFVNSSIVNGYATNSWVGQNYLPLSGGTLNGRIVRDSGGSWISGRNNVIVYTSRTSGEGSDWHPVVGGKTSNGFWTLGSVGGNTLMFSYDTDTDYNASRNNSTVLNIPITTGGTLALTSQIPASMAWSAITSKPFNWSGQSGQPSWLWGSNDGSNYYVWSPSNFNVYSAHVLSTYSASGSGNLTCLQNVFSSLPKSQATAVRLEHGSHSMAIGWFLSGYGYSNAYGGWFISDYGTPSWVGVNNGSWYEATFITSANIGSQSVNYASSANYASSCGNADTTDGLHVHSGRNNEANKIVRTDGNGYIQAGWINTTSGGMGSTAMDRVYCSNDGYIRYKTVADFKSALGSMPASDVYSWAKASTKPSYNFGEIGAGVATIGDGANRIMFRTNTSYASGIYYSTPGNEALVFGNVNAVTSWIFATTNPTSQGAWTGLTPALQIKQQCVYINSLIANGTTPSYRLYVNGDIYATGGVTCASDIRLKNVSSYDLGIGLEQIAAAPTIRYTWKDNKEDIRNHVGSIAQYWQGVMPEVVLADKNDGTLSLQYGVAALVSAITTARKVVDHERRITELEKECERLRTENEQLKLRIA